MAILIKGMEMPKSCSVCPLRMEWKDVSCGGCRVESIWYGTEDDEWKCKARPNWCPLVPVPAHGLIDRGQILDSIRLELAQANAVNDMEDYDSWMRVFDYVRKFPTVIPASEEGE